MKEALNQFMSDYLANFRLSDFYPGPTCQTTPPFLFAMVSVDVLLSLLSALQHNLMVAITTARACVRAHDRARLSMTTLYQSRYPTRRGRVSHFNLLSLEATRPVPVY